MGIKPTSEKAAEYYWFGQKCLDLKTNGARAIIDGIYTIICKFDEEDAVLIVLGGGGIILHPRSGTIQDISYTAYISDLGGSYPETRHLPGVAGGWKDGKTLLDTPYLFPLVDADNASFLERLEDGVVVGEFLGDMGNYGNLYWTNGFAGDDLVVLSWRGTPTRHFRVLGNIDIPGLSIFETATPGSFEDTPNYTTFGTALYQSGEVLALAPKWSWPYNGSGVDGRCLILGAAQNSVDGKVYIVTQSDRYNAPATAKLGGFDKTVDRPGFYLMLWKEGAQIDGWDFVAEYNYGRNGLPWFGNASGTVFVCSNGDTLAADGTLTSRTGGVGSYEEKAVLLNAGTMSFKVSYSGGDLAEFQGDLPVSSLVAASFDASSALVSTASVYKTYDGSHPMMLPSEPPPLTISGTDYFSGGSWTASGGEEPYTWTYPDAGSCGMGTVIVTDACGTVATKQVRMPSGTWVYVSHAGDAAWGGVASYANNTCITPAEFPPNTVSNPPNIDIVGDLRYTVLWRGCTLEGVHCGNAYSGVMTGCAIEQHVSPPCWPSPVILATSGCCDLDYKYRSYHWVSQYDLYRWVCP